MKNQKQSDKDRKEQVYDFLVKFISENLYSPSIREICQGIYLSSTSSVYSYLCKLKDEGRIEVKSNCTRAIKLVGYKLIEEGTDMENIKEKESNRIREKIFNDTVATLKKENPLISEEAIRKFETAFYHEMEKYLFKRKKG